MLRKMFLPDLYCKNVNGIDFLRFYELGFRGIIFDIDNTIVGYDDFEIKKEIIDLFCDLGEIGFKFCFVSNSLKKRVLYFEKRFGVKSFYMALKPLNFGVRKGVKYLGVRKEKILMVGDQIFTDVICARLENIFVVLVEPIKEKKEMFDRFKRKLEKKILARYK